MGYPIGKELEFHYEYDFAVSGGAVGSIALVNKGMNALESGLVLKDWIISVDTTVTSGGSATVTMGNAGITNGYSVDLFASLAAGALLNVGRQAGSLMWDDTNDVNIFYKISSSANAVPRLQVGTAALTAGKFQIYFKAFKSA